MRPAIVLLVCVVFVSAQKNPNFAPGRSGIVHLFEWKFNDIATECESFLGPKGFAGVQVSPIAENRILYEPYRTWWERYQPVSYNIATRSGNEAEFRDMCRRCNAAGVRIYVDIILNHMTEGATSGLGTAGSTYDSAALLFPGAQFGPNDFHESCVMNDYENPYQVWNCELGGLHDLKTESDYVRNQQINFMSNVISLGAAGFRVDAAKHVPPADLEYMYARVRDLDTASGFPSGARPYFYQEVINWGSNDDQFAGTIYSGFGDITEFKYGAQLSDAFRGNNPIRYLQNFGEGWDFMPSGDALVFIDNHDNQRNGDTVLTYKESKLYKMAVAFMLSWPYGTTRVMSSYAFDDVAQSPPADGDSNILGPNIQPDGTCGNGWVCEHRWSEIYNMIEFSNVVAGTDMNDWWDNGDKQIAYCRGGRGFIAFNDDFNVDFKEVLPTCLPAGTYCDIISGSKNGASCTGKTITVGDDQKAYIEILTGDFDGVLAIHVNSKIF